MRVRATAIAVVLGLLWTLANAHQPASATAQQQNPLFLQAQAIGEQVASSSAPGDVKAGFAQRFEALAAEQQNLWSLAGQVDSGQCADTCLDDYNSRVVAWQGSLVQFAAEASSALPQGSAQVTMENRTGQTLDLYIDNQQQCRALMNLFCTSQTSSGFHLVTARSGELVVAAESVNLQPGESYTFVAQ